MRSDFRKFRLGSGMSDQSMSSSFYYKYGRFPTGPAPVTSTCGVLLEQVRVLLRVLDVTL